MTGFTANGDKVKEYIPMSKLDPASYEAYASAQAVIDGLQIDIPVSPIDWIRNEITKAGYTDINALVDSGNSFVQFSAPGSASAACWRSTGRTARR